MPKPYRPRPSAKKKHESTLGKHSLGLRTFLELPTYRPKVRQRRHKTGFYLPKHSWFGGAYSGPTLFDL